MREKIEFTPDYGSKENSSIIKVIGVGGGGGNAVQHMYSDGIVGVDFLICNTDYQALKKNKVPSKLVLGESGLGAGANPTVAKELAIASKSKIMEFIGEETKMLFITAGMGKGTGTGAAPVIAQIAREMGILTIGVVTYPFLFEEIKRKRLAEEGIAEMKKYVDSIIIINNQNIMTYYGDVDFDEAYGYADDVLKNAVKCIAELIMVDAYQNIDFNDIKNIMQNSGVAMLGLATANGANRVDQVVENALMCPLLNEAVITDAKNFLFFINYGPNNKLKMSELEALTKKFEHLKNKNADVIWGCNMDESLDDAIKLSVIITNFSSADEIIESTITDGDADTIIDTEGGMTVTTKESDNPVRIDDLEVLSSSNPTVSTKTTGEKEKDIFSFINPSNPKPQNSSAPISDNAQISMNLSGHQVITQPQVSQTELIRTGNNVAYDDNANFDVLVKQPTYIRQLQVQQEGKKVPAMNQQCDYGNDMADFYYEISD